MLTTIARISILPLLAGLLLLGCKEQKRSSRPEIPEGRVCGAAENYKCERGLLCDLEPGRCGEPSLGGVCVDVPANCDGEEPALAKPVCGCDGKTYESSCARRRARVQKDYDGPCVVTPETPADVPSDAPPEAAPEPPPASQ